MIDSYFEFRLTAIDLEQKTKKQIGKSKCLGSVEKFISQGGYGSISNNFNAILVEKTNNGNHREVLEKIVYKKDNNGKFVKI